MKSLHLFQPQYANLGSEKKKQYWLPYSVACLWSYAHSFADIKNTWYLAGLHYQRRPIADVIQDMQEPDLCAFSCYVWNEQYNIVLAQAIKKKWPKCQIVFGGPQSGSNHLKHDFIDCIIFSEGEQAFLEVLRRCQDNQPLEMLMRRPRLEDLDIPSPYLQGVFDQMMQDRPSDVWFQTVIETNRGCPYACSYCDWGGLTYSKIKKFQLDRIQSELDWIRRHPIATIFLADANFGIFKERDLEIARMIRETLADSSVDFVSLNYAKNSNRTVFEIAKELQPLAKSVTLSMQTMNPETLEEIRRDNLKSNDFEELLKLSHEYQIPTYTDMILGLPLESLATWKRGLMQLIELGNDGFIDANLCNLLQNTELNLEQVQKHRCRTVRVKDYQDYVDDYSGVDEYTEIVCETSTMPLDDMVMSWMWVWLVQFYHTSGYTNWLSRYLHNMLDVPYQDYYDTLMYLTQNDNGPIGDEFGRIHKATKNLLEQGHFGSEISTAYEYYIASYPVFYANRDEVFELAVDAFARHGGRCHDIVQLQHNTIHSPECSFNRPISTDVDIYQWQHRPTQYLVESNVKKFSGDIEDFRVMRRGGFWKNTLRKLNH